MSRAGSTEGFIGLIAVRSVTDFPCMPRANMLKGIAAIVVAGVFIGFYIYNRHRRRLPSSKRSFLDSLPSLSFARSSSDPYAKPTLGLDDDLDTPRPPTFGRGRPGYTRQRSSEWEMPFDGRSSGGKGKGKGRENVDVDMPNEPNEAAYPIRSRSPQPTNPRGSSKENVDSSKRRARVPVPKLEPSDDFTNPFESELNATRHSPPNQTLPKLWESHGFSNGGHAYLRPGEDGDDEDTSTVTSGVVSYGEERDA